MKIHSPSNWRVTFTVMFIAQFLSGLAFSFVLPFFPFYFRDLGVGTERGVLLWVGWSSAAFGITMAISAPLWGLVSDRFGRKLMVIRSMLAGAVVLGLMGLVTNPWHLLFLRILQGSLTGTVTASVALVSSITPKSHRGISLGLMQTAALLGTSAGPFLGGILSGLYGYRVPCGLAFIALFAGTILVIVGATEKFIPPEDDHISGLKTIGGILTLPGFKLILILYFLMYAINMMIAPILPLFIEKLLLPGSKANAVSLTGVFIGVTSLLAGLSAIVYGKLGDRLGYTRILVYALVLAGLTSIPQSFAHSTIELFIERCLFGLAIGGLIPSVNVLVAHTVPHEKVGSAYGLTGSVTCLGIGLGPLIGSFIASLAGLRVPFAVVGISAFIVAFAVSVNIKNNGGTI